VKYLAVCKNPELAHQVLRKASPEVIKALCNVALNAIHGDIEFSEAQRKLFRKHKTAIFALGNRKESLQSKRKVLQQRGAGFWIPVLAGAVSAMLGNSIISKAFK
jgi:hypothetical protein